MSLGPPEDVTVLPYDEAPPADAPVPSTSGGSLLSRIGRSRVYVPEDVSPNLVARIPKRKAEDLEDVQAEEEEDDASMNVDSSLRPNAITLTGPPIEHLPTKKIFAYVAHYADFPPMALEWVNDSTVVIVYETKKQAHTTFTALIREEMPIPNGSEELRLGQKVPQELWPPQLRINKLLGEGAGVASPLSEDIQIRWASTADVKQKGASKSSGFYQRYGENAGKDGRPQWEKAGRYGKRGRTDGWSDTDDARWKHDKNQDGDDKEDNGRLGRGRPTKSDLDAELEAFAHDRDS